VQITQRELAQASYVRAFNVEKRGKEYYRKVIEWTAQCGDCSTKTHIVFMDGNNGNENRVRSVLEKLGWINNLCHLHGG
jgi:hypothetical protein